MVLNYSIKKIENPICNCNKQGYTLVEVLVSITLFILIIAAPTGFLFNALTAQQKYLASQEILDTASYVLEYMSKSLRMAVKQLPSSFRWNDSISVSCLPIPIDGNRLNYEKTRNGNGIKFLDSNEGCCEFYLDVNTKQLKKSCQIYNSSTNSTTTQEISLTPDDLEVINFKIGPSPEGSQPPDWSQQDSGGNPDNYQPYVTIYLEIRGKKSAKPAMQSLLKIQTTVSQRNLDVLL